jgi:hypothetical protein
MKKTQTRHPDLLAISTFLRSFSRPSPKIDFLMHFGCFWTPRVEFLGGILTLLAPVWLPFAVFWRSSSYFCLDFLLFSGSSPMLYFGMRCNENALTEL